ncbi:hypothetical protein [Polyangium aurulentum]|uniref:hypothetical protein n=1 Tax=Polyangium aurulentum TaxID=2567896 RepID=UPI0010AE4196|nr:hypothetical protein [Polyangium aurulentum]UQA61092.1 hypothetical protein E8A73_011680 [Polyangium aurulentum]
MSWVRAALGIALSMLASCAQPDPAPPRENAKGAPSPTPAPPPAAPRRAPELDLKADPVRRELLRAPLKDLAPVGWGRPGYLRVTLDRHDPPGSAPAFVKLALDDAPQAHRRPLAFERLARALGMRVVPATALRRISTGELGAMLEGQPDLQAYFKAHTAVQNDGTVDALVTAPFRGDGPGAWKSTLGREISVLDSHELKRWERWAASPDPAPDESPELLRDYVEMLVLDYLSGNVLRRSVTVDDEGGALLLTDNDTAFPLKVDPRAEARILKHLRAVMRFPRSLREVLLRLDRPRARALFLPEGFDTWIVPPRTLIDLDERRAGLLTLIEARIAERGEANVLCL